MMPDRSARHRRNASSQTAAKTHSGSIIPRTLPVVKAGADLIAEIHAFAGHQRAFLKVQDGCDAHCTYCIIPRLRPTLRSKPIEVAVREAAELVANGHKEIIVTGIFLGAYGQETALRKRFSRTGSTLAALVSALSRIDGLERLRLSSLEPGDVDDALLEVLAGSPRCVPHLHLPLQSGSADVLRRMNRQYSRDDFAAMIERVRSALDRPAITTDVIVGFPGESDDDFAATVEVARHAGFCKIHAFPFSPRGGTAAARWQAQFVPPQTVRDRMRTLSCLESELSLRFRQQFVGSLERVIVESELPAGDGLDEAMLCGRSDRYFQVYFDDEPSRCCQVGDMVDVRIDRVTAARTHGQLDMGSRRDLNLPVLAPSPSSSSPCVHS